MIRRLLAVIALSFIATGSAGAAVINYAEGGAQTNIPGLTGFATTGADMDGLGVTACFTVLGCQTVAWADRAAPGSGGASGTGWDLSLTGDSFGGDWLFEMSDNLGQLLTLLLDGRTSFTIFDRTFGNATGTNGSALGMDWFTTLNGGTTIDVTYLDPTGVGGAAPVGDLFQQVFVDFGMTGPRVDFSFVQDTDNDIRFRGKVPEPATLTLLSFGLLALTAYARRRPREGRCM
jgi:hypothetical protein